tara:strand:- start:266 stop:811 length:546 start_codon:yes stop_codon:yes gene_type:complete
MKVNDLPKLTDAVINDSLHDWDKSAYIGQYTRCYWKMGMSGNPEKRLRDLNKKPLAFIPKPLSRGLKRTKHNTELCLSQHRVIGKVFSAESEMVKAFANFSGLKLTRINREFFYIPKPKHMTRTQYRNHVVDLFDKFIKRVVVEMRRNTLTTHNRKVRLGKELGVNVSKINKDMLQLRLEV